MDAGSGGATGSGGASSDAPAETAPGDGSADATGAMAQATIMALAPGTITGTVTFVQMGEDVQVTYALENCPAGVHPTHIHQGTACGTDGNAAGVHWDNTRGEGIGSGTGQITCDAQMKGNLVYTRMGSAGANLRWTVGGPNATNVVGHALVVHGVNDSNQRYGCGVIMAK
jgi:Cu/Zn superoxide dismutase